MIRSLMCAIKTTCWGCVLIGFTVTIWSILAVQILHPYNQQITRSGYYRDAGCTRCEHAWESVWQSAITITQTVIAGDSWGTTSIALIERFPPTLMFFAGVIFSTSLLILNLVLAVIVEKANQASQSDMQVLEMEKDKETRELEKRLLKSLTLVDRDGSGTISLDELLRCYTSKTDVGAHLKHMGLAQGS